MARECYETLSEFDTSEVEFSGQSSRAIIETDFGEGRIESKILHQCVKEGLAIDSIGRAIRFRDECGTSNYTYYYAMRRPIFVFAQFENKSEETIVITSTFVGARKVRGLEPCSFEKIGISQEERESPKLRLESGESLLIPEMVMLSPAHIDELECEWSSSNEISVEQSQEFYFCNYGSKPKNDYIVIGPSENLQGIRGKVLDSEVTFSAHNFNPNLCYKIARHWNVGSCPHLIFENALGDFEYVGELFSIEHDVLQEEKLVVPKEIVRLWVFELEPEVTVLKSVKRNGRECLQEGLTLNKGNFFQMDVLEGDSIVLVGSYSSEIPQPSADAHFRQKHSLLKAFFEELGIKNNAESVSF